MASEAAIDWLLSRRLPSMPLCWLDAPFAVTCFTNSTAAAATYDLPVVSPFTVYALALPVAAAVLAWWHEAIARGVARLFRLLFGTYQWSCVAVALHIFIAVKAFKHLWWATRSAVRRVFSANERYATALRQRMEQATTYAEWLDAARCLDILEGRENYRSTIADDEQALCDYDHMRHDIDQINAAMESRDVAALQYLLLACVARNKHAIDTEELHLTCHAGTTKDAVVEYQSKIIKAIEFIASLGEDELPLTERRALLLKLKHGFGKTALCLSGGGALAMYHMGAIRALIQAGAMPSVISGSSGGAIVAGFVACRTDEELLNEVFVNDITVRYEPLGLRCFPPFSESMLQIYKTWYAMDSDEFENITKHYYSEPMDAVEKTMYYTFEDAFRKTGRHVSITVSASELTGQRGPRTLLLNHITTPNVLIWSAVATSCSLPMIMTAKQLMARDPRGNVVPYETLGKEWVDGSIHHDLPMAALASAFNATNFIASQVNPHIVPFLSKDMHYPSFRKSVFYTLEKMLTGDMRHRLEMLHLLGLVPKIYGHQFMPFLGQSFGGTVTLIPPMPLIHVGCYEAALNPTPDDMDKYLIGGERMTWRKMAFIKHLCAIENTLNRCAAALPPPLPAAPLPVTRMRRSSTTAVADRRSLSTVVEGEGETRSRRSLTAVLDTADSKLARWLRPLTRGRSHSDRHSTTRR